MKLDELQEGAEYAVHVREVKDSGYSTPARAKLLRIAVRTKGRPARKYRVAVVELLDDTDWWNGIKQTEYVTGDVLELDPRTIWREWALQAQINAQHAAVEKARDANTVAVRRALGVLGLHDQRWMRTNANPGDYEVMLSVLELTKLANAVIELERLVYEWYWEGVEGHEGMLKAEALHLWAEAHDWSNITGEAPPSPE